MTIIFVSIWFLKFCRVPLTKTIEKIGTIFKTTGFILLSIFALLGILFFNFFIYDITHPRVIGSSSIYLKNLFYLQKNYPQIEKIFGTTIQDFAILGEVNPFLSFKDPTVKTINIQSRTTLSVSSNDTYTYNLVVKNNNLKHAISPQNNAVINNGNVKDDFYTSKIIELKFKNARLFIHNMEFYNPAFTGFWTPYEQIDYQFFGVDYLSTVG
jgi:hypothetical protein